jgi:hypothetical protein
VRVVHKIASDLAQRRARQLWLADLPVSVDWDNLPPEEKRANLVKARNDLHEKIAKTPKHLRAEMGAKMHALEMAIHEIRAKMKGPPKVTDFFISVAQERLSKAQYQAIMTEAANRARAAAKQVQS